MEWSIEWGEPEARLGGYMSSGDGTSVGIQGRFVDVRAGGSVYDDVVERGAYLGAVGLWPNLSRLSVDLYAMGKILLANAGVGPIWSRSEC